MTSVTKVSKTAVTSATLTGTTTFMSTWTASVDSSGILSFTNTTATVGISAPTTTISGINTITSGAQDKGSASFSFTSGTQTYTSGTLTVSGSATSAGAHQHGFSHTHAIPSHTHSIASHTHTYNKSVADGTGSAITSLKTASHTPHTHTNTTVAGAHVDGSVIKIINGGSATAVVRDLKNTDQSFTTTSTAPDTSTVYAKVSGTITQPGLTLTKRTFGNTSITPAVDSGEKAIKSISYGSSNFLTGVTITTTSGKSGKNIGGE